MEISHTLQALSTELKNPGVLTNPEQFLGPNWETVLRWWLYHESLTDEQWEEMDRRYDAIDDDTYNRARGLARNAAAEVIGGDNLDAVWFFAPYPEVITYELIANLDDPFFLPLLVPEFNIQPKPTLTWRQVAEQIAQMPQDEPAIIVDSQGDDVRFIIAPPNEYNKNIPALFLDPDLCSEFNVLNYKKSQ